MDLQLTYLTKKSSLLHICCDCLTEEEEQHKLKGERSLGISGGFVHSLSLDISFPFKAIELIIDQAISLKAPHVNISTFKNRDDYELLSFSFQGEHLATTDFLDLSFPNSIILQMMLGSLRLGKTMLYLSCK